MLDAPINAKFVLVEDKAAKIVLKKKTQQETEDTECFPFDDELQHKFYRELPDLSRFMQGSASQTLLQDYQSSSKHSTEHLDLDDLTRKLSKSQSKD